MFLGQNNSEAKETSSSIPHKSCNIVANGLDLQSIIWNVPSAVVIMEKPTGKVTYANARAIELHGFDPCGLEIKDHPLKLKIFDPNGKMFRPEELYTYRALFRGESIHSAPLVIERPDGRKFVVNVTAKPLHDANGNIFASIAIFDDITEQVKVQEALKDGEERLKVAQRIARLGSWEYNVKEDRAIWSDELFRIFALKPQKFGPNITSYINLIHPDDRAKVLKEVQTMSRKVGEKTSYDYRIILPDGTVRFIHSESTIRDVDEHGAPKRVSGIEQDITERKQIEERLAKYSLELERTVEERTKKLRDSERLAAIGQVAGIVGHDMRNPLQTINSEVYLAKAELEQMPKDSHTEAIEESVNEIEKQSDFLSKMTTEISELAKPLFPQLVEVDFCNAVSEAIPVNTIPANVNLSVQCSEASVRLMVDTTFLKRIINNLISNAIQAMPSGGTLTVKTTREGDNAVLSVEDTGVGISKEVQEKLFTPLFTTKSKGQGFGLISIKRMVEALNGVISFQSTVNKGTIFNITIPIKSSSCDYCI